jgi:hypothetical protein
MSQWDDPSRGETRRMPRHDQPGRPTQPGPPYARGQQVPQNRPPTYAGEPPRGHFRDTTANPFGAASDQAFGIASSVMALLGGIVGIVALTGLEWFKGGISFSDMSSRLDSAGSFANGFSAAYFGWVAWVFLIVAVAAAVMASFPSPALRAFRIIGVVVGFAAAGLSFLALQLVDNSSYTSNLAHARIGFYLILIAYILAGVGAAIGPRRV